MSDTSQRITVPRFQAFKSEGHRISMLTAYDYTTAAILDQSGIEGILVGDTMAMVVQGHDTTLPVTLDEIIYHAEMLGRAVNHAMVIVDLPFPTNHVGIHNAVASAGRILKETKCQAVKLEGGADALNTRKQDFDHEILNHKEGLLYTFQRKLKSSDESEDKEEAGSKDENQPP